MKTSRRAEAWLAKAPGAITLEEQVLTSMADLTGAAKEGLLALAVGPGPQVTAAMFDEHITRLCGPKGKQSQTGTGYLGGLSAGDPGKPPALVFGRPEHKIRGFSPQGDGKIWTDVARAQ